MNTTVHGCHSQFLKRLKLILPGDCKPVIFIDAGFKVPWFKKVRKKGLHFIGRVLGNQHVKLPEHDEFISVQELFKKTAAIRITLGALISPKPCAIELRHCYSAPAGNSKYGIKSANTKSPGCWCRPCKSV
ncbi:transposase [Alkalimonas cellulosilytica]|uniref:transposase n=1 Tax=Alkalimonas cellulosilytica TaxID=3058395 RepID=UPI0038B34353